jgi:hypothetical protein
MSREYSSFTNKPKIPLFALENDRKRTANNRHSVPLIKSYFGFLLFI